MSIFEQQLTKLKGGEQHKKIYLKNLKAGKNININSLAYPQVPLKFLY